MTTEGGRHVLIHCFLEVEGTLMQVRSNGYLFCPLESPHRQAVMALLNELNHRLRLVKFTYDPLDGEITDYADLAIIDTTPTSSQVLGLIGFFMERMREYIERIETTIRTGNDPGDLPNQPEEASDDIIR
jgi:hypothetical protein